jgi:hypothetical protein
MSDSSLQLDSSPAVMTRRRSNTSVDMNRPPSLEFLESLGHGAADPTAPTSPFTSFSPPPGSPYRAPLTLPTTPIAPAADGQRQRTLGRRGTPSSPLAFSLSAAVGSSAASAAGSVAAVTAAASSSPTGDRSPSAASSGRRGTKLRLADMRSMKERGQFNEFSSWGINVLENLLGSSSPPPSPPAARALAASSSSASSLTPSTPTTPGIEAETIVAGGGGGGVDLKSKLASASSFISSLVAPSSPS